MTYFKLHIQKKKTGNIVK